jgi:plasmid stability protein
MMIHLKRRAAEPGLRPLTLRNLPPAVARAVKERAARDGVSLNKAVIRMLEEGLKAPRRKPGPIGHALDGFIGVMSAAEADELDRIVAEGRKIDPELWR